jgi:hypothetical protein
MSYNLCLLTDEQRQVAAIDTEVCFWLFIKRHGRITHADIVQVLKQMTPDLRAIYRDRLNHWQPEFHSIASVRNDISDSTWGRIVGSFKKQTARFGQ